MFEMQTHSTTTPMMMMMTTIDDEDDVQLYSWLKYRLNGDGGTACRWLPWVDCFHRLIWLDDETLPRTRTPACMCNEWHTITRQYIIILWYIFFSMLTQRGWMGLQKEGRGRWCHMCVAIGKSNHVNLEMYWIYSIRYREERRKRKFYLFAKEKKRNCNVLRKLNFAKS